MHERCSNKHARVVSIDDDRKFQDTHQRHGPKFEPSDLYWCVHHLLTSRSPFWNCDHKLTFHFNRGSQPVLTPHSGSGFSGPSGEEEGRAK
jgi:hypothetical protein